MGLSAIHSARAGSDLELKLITRGYWQEASEGRSNECFDELSEGDSRKTRLSVQA